MDKYKLLKILIAIVIIVTSVILVLYFTFVGMDSVNEKTMYTEEAEGLVDEESFKEFEKVKYKHLYFTVNSLIERYMTYVNDSIYDDSDIKEISQDALYSIMDSAYLKEFNIGSKEDLLDRYEDFEEKETFNIEDMYVVVLDNNIQLFLVKGNYVLSQDDMDLFIKLDVNKNLFSVFPSEYIEKYNYSEETKVLNKEAESLEENEYNFYKNTNVSNERISVIYFNDLKNDLLNNSKKVYEYLDEEYRNKRFENEENFEKYLNDNKEDLSQIEITGYLVNTYDDYTEYVCRDQYKRLYIFKETAINEYTVQLDDYTLDYKDEEFLEEYNSSKDQYKVANNINKWVKMINNRDYKAAYNVLDKTFRENEFGNEEKFKEYMQRAFPSHYELDFEEFTEKSGIYSQKILLKGMATQNDNDKEKTIIMRLGEGTSFIMSFNITKADNPM